TVISRSQIDADLAQIKQSFRCVRTYSVSSGLAEVPAMARKHGLRVILGLWIGNEAADNELEIKQGLAVLKRDADVINAVIVGNEVLLRRDQPASVLIGYLRRVRAATSVPVTYADVWEFWLRNPEVLDATNFVTIHILPYWEDDPIAADRAVDHVLNVYNRVHDAFPGRRILIGETGWPSAGRQREGALPSLVNQAAFIRNFSAIAQERALDYNLVEAYDQPWKRALEGTVGGHWGIFNADGDEKFARKGPVAENPQWQRGWAAAAVMAAVFVVLAAIGIRAPGLLLMVLAGTACGGALWQAGIDVAQWARNFWETFGGNAFILVSGLASFAVARALAASSDGIRLTRVPAPAGVLPRWFMTDQSAFGALERLLGLLRFVLLAGMSVVCLLLLADPRYRDFPVALFVVPSCGYALLRLIADERLDLSCGAEERAMALLIAVTAAGIALQEGWQNLQALEWSALCLLFAGSIIVPGRRRLSPPVSPR
ncbi:MAG TPA: glycosyl hydrolase family 17 protein, partial [Burkholderiales bacterium]|nr:glycosyl hydrolase family 17 protein [Burkholderiales bacterium]